LGGDTAYKQEREIFGQGFDPDHALGFGTAGRVRPIAALTENRLTTLPQVPTIKEQGINVPIIANARGILAPPGVSKEVVSYWEDFFARLIKTTSWKEYLEENQVENVFVRGGGLGPFLDEQTQLMRSVLRQAGVEVAR
jgi:putative tricarboxylic transport membrane protein